MGFAVDELIGSCVEALREDDVRAAVTDVLRERLTDPNRVADALPDRAGITLLHHAPDLTIINVVWAPGMRIFAHDHRMWAVIGVYAGREENEFFRRPSPGLDGLVTSNGRTLEAGNVVALGDDTIHAVHNPGTSPTGAIHVYGGDFVNEPRSQWRPPGLVEEPYDAAAVARAFDDANIAWQRAARVTNPDD